MGETDDFETLAARFKRETGLLAPGKDPPLAMWSLEEDKRRRLAWDVWLAKLHREAAP